MSATNSTHVDTILTQTRAQWLQLRASAGHHFDKLVIGVAVFTQSDTHSGTRLLIIRRAANEDYYPNCFEMPSGKVDDGETISQALKRELVEETGLTLIRVMAQLPEITYTTEKTVVNEGKEVHIVKTACQLNFAIEASSDQIRLNEVEHSEWKWANVEEMKTVQMTELMHKCTENALDWAKEQLN